MSTGAELPAPFIQENQGMTDQASDQPDHHATQSTILYLLQEASKLAVPIHNSYQESKSSPDTPSKKPRQDSTVKREANGPCTSFHSSSPSQPISSYIWSCNQPKICQEQSKRYPTTTFLETSPRCSSPWEVMSLINFQCEMLLHSRDLNSTKGSERENKMATIKPCDENMGDLTAGHSEETSDAQEQWCVKDSKTDNAVTPQIWEPGGAKPSDPVDKNTTVDAQLEQNDTTGVKQGVCTRFHGYKESEEDCAPAEQDRFNISLSTESSVSYSQNSPVSNNTSSPLTAELLCNSTEDTDMAVSPSLATVEYFPSSASHTLDFNSILLFTFGSQVDLQSPSERSTLPYLQTESVILHPETRCQKRVQQVNHVNINITESEIECQQVSKEETGLLTPKLSSEKHMGNSAPPPPLHCIITSKAKHIQAQADSPPAPEQGSSAPTWRSKASRKQPHPTRSVDICDPHFQGVTFRIHTQLDDNREQCRLLITSKYSEALYKSIRKSRVRSRSSQNSLRTSSSEEESDPLPNLSKEKVCASCCTKTTPMWRDAEDGTPLCNACGIRYKKYRVRCIKCWHIPRKEENSSSCCFKCGDAVRLTTAQRKHLAKQGTGTTPNGLTLIDMNFSNT